MDVRQMDCLNITEEEQRGVPGRSIGREEAEKRYIPFPSELRRVRFISDGDVVLINTRFIDPAYSFSATHAKP